MKNNEVFKFAMLDYDGSLKLLAKTTLSVIEKIIRGINVSELSEKQKREKLEKAFSKIKGSHEFKIMGVKQAELAQVIDTVFKLQNSKISNESLQKVSMNEILHYFCYISRMTESKIEFQEEELHRIREEVEENRRVEEERVRLEQEAEQQAAKKAEEQKKKKEEALKKAEEQRLASMSEVDRKIEELPKEKILKNEQAYSNFYKSLDKFDSDDKLKAAKVLKEYWIGIGKWDGKLASRQKDKVEKVKEVLNEK